MRLFDDVEAMLAELRSKGYRLAVLTNCDDDLFEITHRSFKAPFDLFLTSERVRGYKPARWHFRGFELLTGVGRSGAGCTWLQLVPRHRAGARAGDARVWLDRERSGEDAGASIHVHNPLEIAGIVDQLVEDDSALLFDNRSPVVASA